MDVLKRIKAAARKQGLQNPWFCFDKPNVHQNLDYDYIGIDGQQQIWPQPTLSPDFNQVIEHFHAYVLAAFKEQLQKGCSGKSPKQYARMFKTLAKKIATSEVVGKDVERLPKFYEEVVKMKGDWPAKRFR
jgi:hypothetical protein